jgi:hypothetical protein
MVLNIIIGVSIATCIICFFLYLKRRQDEVEANFQKHFAGKSIKRLDKTALFIAQESDGLSHTRGIGNLVLTDEKLFFERRVGNKVLDIPIDKLTKVESVKRLAGQSTIFAMLKITFIDDNGIEDSFGLRVKDLQDWIDELSGLIKQTDE